MVNLMRRMRLRKEDNEVYEDHEGDMDDEADEV